MDAEGDLGWHLPLGRAGLMGCLSQADLNRQDSESAKRGRGWGGADALAHHGLSVEERSPQFRATLAAMEVLSTSYGAENVRLVFWFDN
jgi:hypothetical protein